MVSLTLLHSQYILYVKKRAQPVLSDEVCEFLTINYANIRK
jgi:DNA replicative helicase MCM subunit Mcm2 (Cdc46/Mcm family)